uniref:Filament-like plant protein 7 n=1 Tax=Kalanchoe fedtschenkoi TaxID=63787 RepID=A0A7N0T9P7_KALFE
MESSSKAWSWRKKTGEKAGELAEQGSNIPLKVSGDEVNGQLNDKATLERELQHLNDKLLRAQSENRAKDDLVKKHARVAQEAIAGWEKAESEAVSLKETLDVALQQYRISDQRCDQLDGALKECMQQLRFVREQQEQRIHDVLLKTTAEFEKTKMSLEEKLSETSKRMSRLGVENARLTEAVLHKDKMISEIRELKTRAEANCNSLMTRLDVTEKDNASLKYEIRVLEKELEIRNEEREFNRRAADASHRKQLESVKKLIKLESECQRLRVLVRKRLPGPVALAKMKDEVAMLEKDSTENKQRRTTQLSVDDSPDTPSCRINTLAKDLYALEEENSNLKKTINNKVNELQMSRVMYVRAASRLSQAENLLEELSKVKMAEDVTMNVLSAQERAMSVISDIGNDDKFSYAESWASALNSEQGQGEKLTNIKSVRPSGICDMNLMDDFLEMEKLALTNADKLVRKSHIYPDIVNATSGPLDTVSSGHLTEVSGPDVVHMSDPRSPSRILNQSIDTSTDCALGDCPVLIQEILKLISEQQRLTQRSHLEILGEIQVAMEHKFTLKAGSYDTETTAGTSMVEKSSHHFQPNFRDAIDKMIELLEGVHLKLPDHDAVESFNGSFVTGKCSETDTGYMVRVFQWKACELSHIVGHLVEQCNDLLRGKADTEKFVVSLTSAFDWIMNHCFSIQDVSSMRDEIKNHLDWDDTRSECETEAGSTSHLIVANKFHSSRDQTSLNFTAFKSRNVLFEDSPREGSQRLKDELLNVELAKKDLETKLQDAIDQCESLQHKFQMSEKTVTSLHKQVETLKESKRMAEDQTERHMFANEELHSQLTEARVDLNEAIQKIVALEVELENKSAYCEDLEATCVELQLQLQRFETLLLKAMASPKGSPLFDKVIISTPSDPTTTAITTTALAPPTTPIKKTLNRQRTSLLDKMLAEDDAHASAFSPKTKEIVITSSIENSLDPPLHSSTSLHGPMTGIIEPRAKFQSETIHSDDETVVKSLVVVQNKKRGGWSLWRRLFRRRRGVSRRIPLSNGIN